MPVIIAGIFYRYYRKYNKLPIKDKFHLTSISNSPNRKLFKHMNLSKQKLISMSIFQQKLSNNFTIIQQEFKKIKQQIFSIKYNSKLLLSRANQSGSGSPIYNEPNNSQPHHWDSGHLAISHVNNYTSNKNNRIEDSSCQNQNPFTQENRSVAACNFQTQQKMKHTQSPRISQFKQQQKPIRNTSDSILRQFIKDLQHRMSAIEKQSSVYVSRIDHIEKDNERIRKVLGFKDTKAPKNHKKEKERENKVHDQIQNNHDAAEVKEQQITKIQYNENTNINNNQNSKQNINNKFQEKDIRQLQIQNEQIQQFGKLGQYLQKIKQKVRQQIDNISECLHKYIRQLQLTKQQVSLVKQNQQELKSALLVDKQSKPADTHLSQTRPTTDTRLATFHEHTTPQKNKPLNKSRNSICNKLRTSASELGHLNDTVQSYRNYYEDKIVQIFQEMDKIRSEYFHMLDKLTGDGDANDTIKLASLANKITAIPGPIGPMDQKFKKQLSHVKRQHKKLRQQFNQLIGNVNIGANQTRTLIIKPNQNKQDWKDVTQKIFKLKQQLLSYVKQLENKISLNNDMAIVIQELEVGISQCKILNGKKVNITDFEKFVNRIQNRLNNFIKQVCQKQGMSNQQQALLAKQPWFCLSCDSQIKNYSAKLGKTLNNEKFLGKKVNPELHMVRRPDQSRLPSVY